MIASAEELRGALNGLPGVTLAVSLTRPGEDTDADRQTAKALFGLEPRAQPDGEPHCDYCGRSSPPSGLEDQSLGGPPVHECNDSADCQTARAEREGKWIDRTWKTWPIDLQKYRAAQEYERELEARKWQTGDIYRNVGYQLSAPVWQDPDELTALDYAALEQVRLAVEHNLERRAPEYLELTGISDPATPQAPPPVIKFDPWGHTLAAQHNRTHLLGYHRQHRQVTDAASVLARKAVRARSG